MDKKKCINLLDEINKIKGFNKSNIFLKESEFLKNPSFKKKNPGKDKNNILLNKDLNLDFVFNNDVIKKTLTEILGKNYKIDLSKIVMGIPKDWVPTWIINKLKLLKSSNNLNPFINEIFR